MIARSRSQYRLVLLSLSTLLIAACSQDQGTDTATEQMTVGSVAKYGWYLSGSTPIAKRAHEHGLRVSGHIPAFMSAEQAVKAAYDEIQHINMVFLNFLAGDREDTRQQIRFTLYGDEAGNLDLKSDEVQDFFALLKANNVSVDPTAAIFDTALRHRAGTPDRSYAAFTIHREIELYAEAGIPIADVLRIATLDSARITGVADRKGSIEVNKDADLVLLDGNPFDDISAIRRAVLVTKGDTPYRPDQLYNAVGVKPFLPSIEL